MSLFDLPEDPYPPEPPDVDDDPYGDDEPPFAGGFVERGDHPSPFERGMAGSALASHRWTLDERDQVDQAIETVARRLETFTSDDVWAELGDDFPVTKGMSSRFNRARNRGLIVNTGETRIASREGAHNKAQRLSVWRSRVRC